ncbi:uridine kinase [Nocardioides bruguierae]|uniref:uridine kinase n=1 Tax=Nocardioides bruguierae TaxID=2945102 RepID=UPI0020217774|nr:uridine kinase [Nocardioides bruguierae]MCL8026566.1 uridine kinase [Nocardioides bruguierae]
MSVPAEVRAVAEVVAATPRPGRPVLVAVDGVDGAGKTTWSGHLRDAFRTAGRWATVVHLDDFLHPRAVRYRLGRDSPVGFVADTYDLAAFRRCVLDPLAAPGSSTIVPAAFDHRRDVALEAEPLPVPDDGVVVVEGMFCHRAELRGAWDVSVLLDVPFEVSVARLAGRDGTPADPEHPALRRYVEGQRRYLAAVRPAERATFVVR